MKWLSFTLYKTPPLPSDLKNILSCELLFGGSPYEYNMTSDIFKDFMETLQNMLRVPLDKFCLRRPQKCMLKGFQALN